MKPNLVLREWKQERGIALDDQEVLAIEESTAGIELRREKEAGRYTLRATHFVGTLVLPERRITLLPKVSVGILFDLLGWLERPNLGPLAPGALDPDVTRAMAHSYITALESALGRAGVLGEWMWLEQDSSTFSGRVDWMDACFRRFGIVPPIRVRTLELHEDSPLNRRLFAALELVKRVVDLKDLPTDRLQRLTRHFVNTTLARRPEPATLDARTSRFGVALRVADTILNSMSIRFDAGERAVATFLADMNVLYETFLLGNLELALRASGMTLQKHPRGFAFDDVGQLPLNPDAVMVDATGAMRVVIDTKYKRAVTQADLNQIMVYCATAGVEVGVLVVADGSDKAHVVRGVGIQIYVRTLSLDGDAETIRGRIQELAESLIALGIRDHA